MGAFVFVYVCLGSVESIIILCAVPKALAYCLDVKQTHCVCMHVCVYAQHQTEIIAYVEIQWELYMTVQQLKKPDSVPTNSCVTCTLSVQLPQVFMLSGFFFPKRTVFCFNFLCCFLNAHLCTNSKLRRAWNDRVDSHQCSKLSKKRTLINNDSTGTSNKKNK